MPIVTGMEREPQSNEAKPSAFSAWAFWLGVVSLTGLGPLTGLLGVALGAVAYRREKPGERSTLALAGIVCGALGSALGILVLIGGIAYLQWARPAAPPTPIATLPAPALPEGHPPLGAARDDAPDAVETPTSSAAVGHVTLVNVAAHDRHSLVDLVKQHHKAGAATLIYVRAEHCAPCQRFERTLAEATMQRALGDAVLIAVDAISFDADLRRLRIDSRDIPTFVRLDQSDPPFAEDAITGAEWDEDTAANMAPVFSRFMAGTLQKRREPPPFVGISL